MIQSRPVAALARRTAFIAASVPELTNRTRSIDGISERTFSPSCTSTAVGAPQFAPERAASPSVRTRPRGAWPWMSAPPDMT